jgi:hypothetical protein
MKARITGIANCGKVPCRSTTFTAIVAALWASSSLTSAYGGTTASLIGIGHLPGGNGGSDLVALSRDGTTAVGWSRSAHGTEAIRFRDGTIQSLGDFDGGDVSSRAICVSADGNTIGGQGTAWGYLGTAWGNIYPPFVWTPASGLQGVAGFRYGEVRAITPDGAAWAIAGAGGCPWHSRFGWLGNQYVPSGVSDVRALSDDGLACFGGEMSVTVGCDVGNCTNTITNRVSIDRFSGARASSGRGPACVACSADGSTGIAPGGTAGIQQWSASGLTTIPGTGGLVPCGATPNLQVIVGNASISGSQRAVVWSPKTGMLTVEAYVSTVFGVSVTSTGLVLTSCNGVSSNGLVFAGSGVAADGSQEGWMLRVLYDWNNNGTDDTQEIKDGLIVDVDGDGIADCYESGTDCPGPSIVENPGFESGTGLADCSSELLLPGSTIGAWRVISGVAERANRPIWCDPSEWAAQYGSYALELRSVGAAPGVVRQVLSTERGHRYRVGFWMSANCANGGTVSVTASAGRSFKTFTRACQGNARLQWIRCDFDFVAALATEVLEFASDGQPSAGPVLDAISVSDVTVGCPADLDGSGTVDGADLGLLLSLWGTCPG